MQILLAVNETIVRINSKPIKIEYIQDFINTHFQNKVIKDNYIFIPQSKQNNYHRTFLLKWLYMLYIKRTKNEFSRLKESLIDRQHKAIKIILPQKIVHKITWRVIDNKTINIQIVPSNYQIVNILKKAFKTNFFISATHFTIEINTEEEKKSLYKLLNSSSIIKVPHLHIYNKSEMDDFLLIEKRVQDTEVNYTQAHAVLGSFPNDNAKTLKKKYKQLAMQFHPDKAEHKDEKTLTLYTKKFQNILHAYEILSCRVS